MEHRRVICNRRLWLNLDTMYIYRRINTYAQPAINSGGTPRGKDMAA